MSFGYEWIDSLDGEVKVKIIFENGKNITVDITQLRDYCKENDGNEVIFEPFDAGIEISDESSDESEEDEGDDE